MKYLLPLWRCNPNDLTFAEVRTLARHNKVGSIPIVVQRVVAGCIVVVALREVRMRLLALIPQPLLNRCHKSVLHVYLSDAFFADVDNLLVVQFVGVRRSLFCHNSIRIILFIILHALLFILNSVVQHCLNLTQMLEGLSRCSRTSSHK